MKRFLDQEWNILTLKTSDSYIYRNKLIDAKLLGLKNLTFKSGELLKPLALLAEFTVYFSFYKRQVYKRHEPGFPEKFKINLG